MALEIETIGDLPTTSDPLDLIESARCWVLLNLPYDRTDTNMVLALEQKDARSLLLIYGNWLRRRIEPRPRSVMQSQAMRNNPAFSLRQAEIDTIAAEIEAGEDITKRLSRRINIIVDDDAAIPGRRRDLDLFLNEWGMHHLHLSSEIEPDGFVKRDGPLLIAMFKREKAYFIDIVAHNQWTDQSLLEVLVDEFLDESLIHVIHGALDVAYAPNPDEHRTLRNNGINSILKVRGKVVMADGGMLSTGQSMLVSRAVDTMLVNLKELEDRLKEAKSSWLAKFTMPGRTAPRFEFTFLAPSGYGVIEAESRTLIDAWLP